MFVNTRTPLRPPPTNTAAGRITVLEFKPFEKNTLLGFLSLELPSGIILHGCTLHQKNGSRWVGLPAKPFVKDDGVTSWTPIVEITNKAAREKFQNAALNAVDRYLQETQ